MKIKIYHNPRWGKSRSSVGILENSNIEFEIIEYLKNPPSKSEIKNIISILNIKAKDIIRTTEADFRDNHISKIMDNESKLLDAIVRLPKILQRPIVIFGNKGVIGRPPENIYKILQCKKLNWSFNILRRFK